ncbi:hypothetical protein [Bacillus haynesii]
MGEALTAYVPWSKCLNANPKRAWLDEP